MSVRPKLRNGNGRTNDLTNNELYCGYVMHQYKGIKSKMRWGQLWTEKNENDKGRCCIKLFKFDVVNQKNEFKKDLKQKLSFEFDEEDFCGLEKGEHYTRNGMRRYICIILRHEHLIVQDAITARTDTDHNVIATWYKQISIAMQYMKSWKMLSDDRECKFLHASRMKLCECYSLHNSSVGMKGKPLLIGSWNIADIQHAEEAETMFQNTIHTCITFSHSKDAKGKKVSFCLEGAVKLKDFLPRTGKTRTHHNMMGTLCPGFDDLNLNPNLVRITDRDTGVKKVKPAPMNLRELSDKQRVKCSNNYYGLQVERDMGHEIHNSLVPLADVVQALPENRNGNIAYENRYVEQNEPFRPLNDLAPRPHMNRTYRPQPPPHDHHDESKLKNNPEAVTQVSVDSDYQTGEIISDNHSDMDSHLATLNLQQSPNVTANHDQQMSSPHDRLVCDNNSVNSSDPPAIPKREDLPSNKERVCDLVENALLQQQLPPIDTRPESFRPGYENSLSIEVSIAEILRDYDRENRDIGLHLPYSVYISLVLGLEKESVANGSWRGLASALCLTLNDVEQIEAAVKNHSKLLQAEILLLHWSRTQAPYPFTRSNFRSILSEVMGRQDLANLIPEDEPNQQNKGDDSRKNDPNFRDPKN